MAEPKADLRKLVPGHFGAPAGEWASVDLPPTQYLMIDGQGSPGDGPEYRRALEALYPAAYTIKFHSKQALGRDYVVPPLEGLWWSDDLHAFTAGRRDEWRWTMMLMLPEWIGQDAYEAAIAAATSKKPDVDFSRLRREALCEGACLQTLHLGRFADEAPVLAKLHDEIMPARGLTFAGPHHEVYLSDPRRTAPDKLRTILRQPVKPACRPAPIPAIRGDRRGSTSPEHPRQARGSSPSSRSLTLPTSPRGTITTTSGETDPCPHSLHLRYRSACSP